MQQAKGGHAKRIAQGRSVARLEGGRVDDAGDLALRVAGRCGALAERACRVLEEPKQYPFVTALPARVNGHPCPSKSSIEASSEFGFSVGGAVGSISQAVLFEIWPAEFPECGAP